VLGDIYLGKITKWNDPALVKINANIKLPDAKLPSFIARMDREPHLTGSTIFLRSATNGKTKLVKAPPFPGHWGSAVKATKVLPLTSSS